MKRNFDDALVHQEYPIAEVQKLLGPGKLLPFDSKLHIQSVGGFNLDGSSISTQGMKVVDSSKVRISFHHQLQFDLQ